MSKKLITIILISYVIAIGVGVYGGMKYAQSKTQQDRLSQADFQNLRNLSPEERQQRLQELGADVSGALGDRAGRGQFGSGLGGLSLSGEIIAQNEDDLTIKLIGGSTKIVFVSSSTEITKSVDGAMDDLNEGEQITISGEENSDGSWTAKRIQLRNHQAIAPMN